LQAQGFWDFGQWSMDNVLRSTQFPVLKMIKESNKGEKKKSLVLLRHPKRDPPPPSYCYCTVLTQKKKNQKKNQQQQQQQQLWKSPRARPRGGVCGFGIRYTHVFAARTLQQVAVDAWW
jgi:hypothetical protein